MEIKDKVIIVTGASKGIGLSIAKKLSSLGGKVVVAARSLDILKKEFPKCVAVKTDMRNFKDIKDMIDMTVEKYGRVDILVNNAGQGLMGSFEKTRIDDYKAIMELNVYGVMIAMQTVIPIMRKQGGGMILNISSGVTKMYIPDLSAYSSTKYALNAISLIARQELEKDKIVVSLVHPNLTSTNFIKNGLGNKGNWEGREMPEADSPEKVADTVVKIINSEEAEIRV